MDAIFLISLLSATLLLLVAALVSLYRYLERKALFPQLPRLWRGDRNRFFVFGAMMPLCAAGFVAYSLWSAQAEAPEAPQAPAYVSPLDALEQAKPTYDDRQPPAEAVLATPPPEVGPTPAPMTPAQQADFDMSLPPQPGPEQAADGRLADADEEAARAEGQALLESQGFAEAAPTAEPTPRATPESTAEPTPEPTPEPTAGPAAARGAFMVGLTSFDNPEDARINAEKYRDKGLNVTVVQAVVRGHRVWRVVVPGYQSRGQAEEARQSILDEGLARTPWVIHAP